MKQQIVNDATYRAPVYPDALYLDAKPIEGSFNAVTSNGVAKAIAEGGGTTYTAGDGIDINDGTVSTKLADGSGLRFDDGGLQIVHQLATPGAEDEGKVLTVTNSLGAYAWRDPSGGSSTVSTSGCLLGDGSQADPLRINRDGSLLDQRYYIELGYGNTFDGQSGASLFINANHPTYIVFTDITASMMDRTVSVVISKGSSMSSVLWSNTAVLLARGARTVTATIDISDLDTDKTTTTWDMIGGVTYYVHLVNDSGNEILATATIDTRSSKLGVLMFDSNYTAGHNGDTLKVTSDGTGVEWASSGALIGAGSQASPLAIDCGFGIEVGSVDASASVTGGVVPNDVKDAFEGDGITIKVSGINYSSASNRAYILIDDYNGFYSAKTFIYDGQGSAEVVLSKSTEDSGNGTWGDTYPVNLIVEIDDDWRTYTSATVEYTLDNKLNIDPDTVSFEASPSMTIFDPYEYPPNAPGDNAFDNMYNSGSWGYMGVGDIPDKDAIWIYMFHELPGPSAPDGAGVLVYDPNDTTKYAVYSDLLWTGGNTNRIPEGSVVKLDLKDASKWTFSGGMALADLVGSAICLYAVGTTGNSPNGCDYWSMADQDLDNCNTNRTKYLRWEDVVSTEYISGFGGKALAATQIATDYSGKAGKSPVVNSDENGLNWVAASLLSNTAGITDIVSVASLPANPDAHTLYLVTGV